MEYFGAESDLLLVEFVTNPASVHNGVFLITLLALMLLLSYKILTKFVTT